MQIFPTVVFEGGGDVTLNDFGSANVGISGSTVNYGNYTVNPGSDKILVLFVGSWKFNTASAIEPTTATFNNVDMHLVIQDSNDDSASRYSLTLFRLYNPPEVTANIVVTYNTSLDGSAVLASVLHNAKQSSNPNEVMKKETTNTYDIEKNITTEFDETMVIDCFNVMDDDSLSNSFTANAKQTLDGTNNIDDGFAFRSMTIGQSHNVESVAGLVNYNWKITGSPLEYLYIVSEWEKA